MCFLISNSRTLRIIQRIKRIWDFSFVCIRCMKIYGCSLYFVVSQQFLYRVQVCPLFQKVGGKRVAEHVYMHSVLDARTPGGFFQHFHQCACRVRLSGRFALKQPFLRSVFTEVPPQLFQQLGRKQRVAAFLALAHDTHGHHFAVDVFWCEVQQFTTPQSG